MDNQFSLKNIIIERLKAALPTHVAIIPLPPLAGLLDEQKVASTQPTPSVHLWLKSHLPGERRGNARFIYQEWYVAVVVRNVANIRSGEDAELEAGQLINLVLDALDGWRPKPLIEDEDVNHPVYGEMDWVASYDAYWVLGFIHYAMSFKTQFIKEIYG